MAAAAKTHGRSGKRNPAAAQSKTPTNTIRVAKSKPNATAKSHVMSSVVALSGVRNN
jgi:hypothetical protein